MSRRRILQQTMKMAVRDFRDAKEWYTVNNHMLNETNSEPGEHLES